jgi:hypothetical protein
VRPTAVSAPAASAPAATPGADQLILGFLVVLTSRQRLLGPAANPPLLRAVATAVVVVVGVLSAVVLVQTVLGWAGIG